MEGAGRSPSGSLQTFTQSSAVPTFLPTEALEDPASSKYVLRHIPLWSPDSALLKVLLSLASQWEDLEKREEMVQSGHQVIRIIDSKLGAGSLSSAPDLPGPGIFRKLHVKLSNSYDKGWQLGVLDVKIIQLSDRVWRI